MTNFNLDKLLQYNRKIHNDPLEFGRIMLGLDFHEGQIRWIKNSTKRINILRPGNRWGKSLILAIKHIWQCMCKPNLDNRVESYKEWSKVEYQTLNFGPTYELGRGVLQIVRDLVQGNFLLPSGKTNHSYLADWAIVEDRSDAQVMPNIEFRTGAKLLGRSYSEMGVAFKMKAIAYLSGDECADIAELWTFTNNTLLPRMVSLNGQIDFAGTPQPEGIDYLRMIEMAQEDMKTKGWTIRGLFYTQKGSMYENTFLPREAIEEIERIADPVMREQIIRGEYVEIGEKYFGFERIQNAVDKKLKLINLGWGQLRKYVTAVDFAGGESAWADFTVIMTIDYTREPYKLIYFNRFKGGDIPIPSQYQLVEEVTNNFGGKGTVIVDNSSLGGRNAMQFLSHLSPIPFETLQRNKAEMLATLKIAFDGGQSVNLRRERERTDGVWQEKNPRWGLVRIPNISVLVNELVNYKLEDKKIRQDCVMCLGMAIHWIEMRRPKKVRRQAVDFDLAAMSV